MCCIILLQGNCCYNVTGYYSLNSLDEVSIVGLAVSCACHVLRSCFPNVNLASFLVAIVRLGHCQYPHEIVVRFDDILVRDHVSVSALKVPLADRPFQEQQNDDDQGNDQYRDAGPQDRIKHRRVVFALQFVTRYLGEKFAIMLIRCVASAEAQKNKTHRE